MTSPPPPRPYSRFTNVNGTLYFTDHDSINGEALWKIDRNENAVLVKNIKPGANSSYSYGDSSNLTNVNGTLYFNATDATNGAELWKIDSSGNPVLVKDINPGADSSSPYDLTNVNGTLYFNATNATNGAELWQIDSTGNAVLVEGINPGAVSSFLYDLTNINGTLYFNATDATNGRELWKIDSSGNPVLVEDINPGADSSSPYDLTNVNGTLYFNATNATNGAELWKIDSTGNAVLVEDINPGADSSSPYNLTNVNGTLYFTASDTTAETDPLEMYNPYNDPNTEKELWKIDSTGNAVLVEDINPSADFSDPRSLTNVNGTLYFTAYNDTNGRELWKIDSIGNPVLVKDINPGTQSSYLSDLTNVNGILYFKAYDDTNGEELWQIDSTGKAVLVKDINPGADSSRPYNLTNVDGTLYFAAYDSINERKLWKIDSTDGDGIPVVSPLRLPPNQLFNRNLLETTSTIKGVSIQAVSQKQTNKVNEIGFFNVDDRNGKVGGIAPGEAGYLKVAIERSKSILTTLGGDFFNTQKQEIGLDPNKIYQFFEVENGSLTEVKQKLDKGETPTNIRLANLDANGNSPIKVTGNSLQSGYNVSINNDELVLKVTKLDGVLPSRPIGSDNQGKIEGRTIDLTKYTGQSLKVDITTKSDAVYQSQIGFYTVKDALGTIELADGTTVKPGDANYAMVAVKNAIANAGLRSNRIDTKTDRSIAGGQIYAPVVVAQGTMDDFINKTSNNIQAYFNYVGANTDKVDHFRQIGANTFGVEDMYGGGDRDFNDLVIQTNIKTV